MRKTYVVAGDSITFTRTDGGRVTWTERELRFGWGEEALAKYAMYLERLGFAPITSLPADSTEQAEIDAAKCQPAHVSHVEPERAELPYFRQRTEFDPFGPGYEVYSDAVSSGFMPAQPKAPLHPLQKVNEGGNALHGSAFLLV
jgi:hypothetical protein